MGEHQQLNNESEGGNKGFPVFIKEYWIIIFSAVLFVFIASFITATVAVRMNQPKIVTFDLKGTTDEFNAKTAMLGEKATARDVEDMAAIFNQSMQESLSQYESKGYIIMVKPAVISGTNDITAEVRANIYRNLRGDE